MEFFIKAVIFLEISKRAISEVSDSAGDCSSTKRKTLLYHFKPFGKPTAPICKVQPMVAGLTCQLEDEAVS